MYKGDIMTNTARMIPILLVVFALATITKSSSDVLNSLNSLCENKSVDLMKISQVIELIDQIETSEKKRLNCPNEILDSLMDLKPVIAEDMDEACSMNKVQKIRDYHSKYIHGNSIPASLLKFFIGFGLKVSELCKKNMINLLEYDAPRILSQADKEALDAWTNNKSKINEMISSPNDFDDLITVSELVSLMGDAGAETQKLYIQTATNDLIIKMKATCNRRFKPIYERLITPLMVLANLGYNFNGEELERELKEFTLNQEVHRWYRIVYLCDSLANLNLIEVRGQSIKDGKVVRIMTESEVNSSDVLNEDQTGFEDLEQLSYKPEGKFPINDEIIDKSDKQFMKQINGFSTKKNEVDRIRLKVLRKVGFLLKENLLRGKIRAMSSLFGFKSNGQAETSDNVKEDIIKALDESVREDTLTHLDQPVAGPLSYMKRVYHQTAVIGPTGLAQKYTSKAASGVQIKRYFWPLMSVLVFVIGVIVICIAG